MDTDNEQEKMKTFTRHLLVFITMLLCGTSSHAADLITQQITINVEKAGTLPDKIGNARLPLITNLKLIGELNGTDFKYLHEYGTEITALDLEEAKIVEGGESYSGDNHLQSYCTSNNTIGTYMFYDFARMSSIILPEDVTSIEPCAFWGCSALASLNIPLSVISIGQYAFYECSSLVSINIPSNVTSIGLRVFAGCTSLASINIPSSVTYIGNGAFYGCTSLASINIPSSVTSIGDYAFSGCASLSSITIPSSVTSIGDYVFSGCTALSTICLQSTTPQNIEKIGLEEGILTIYIPKGTYMDYWMSNWGNFNLVEYDVTGVEDIKTSDDGEEVSRYSINGTRLSAPTKGINIIKTRDGNVRKVIVK